ncbi:MAG TPA: hypothetical protein VFI66_04585 [Gemmatimonadales bacterium]|nr:hypothetical protein [Gemmatimonadales bacterium]
MLVFFAVLGWAILLEGLKRRIVVSGVGLVAHSPWRREPVRLAWAQLAGITFAPLAGNLVFVDRAGARIRVGTMMSGLDQLIAAARRDAPAGVPRDGLTKLEQRRARGGF